jgi:hypothetical protein
VPVPEHLDWCIWRLVTGRVASLQEIDTHYDIVEVFDANEALDLTAEAEFRNMPKPPSGAKRR